MREEELRAYGSFNNRIIAWQPKPKPYKAEIDPQESEVSE